MKNLTGALMLISFLTTSASAQSNKIVFGPLEGDDAGVLTVRNGEAIEIELWVRTDPENPAPVVCVIHGLLSEDAIIAVRNGVEIDPDYDMPNWESVWVDGPYVHNPADDYPIPLGYTCEMQGAYWYVFEPWGDPLDTDGEWDYYGAFLMTCNTNLPVEEIYYPFATGWFPHSGQGTSWSFEAPPGGSVEPEQDYCGLHFAPVSNKIVFGPLEGDDAGILTVHNGEAIGIEMWVRTDPDNPTAICAMAHGLSSDDFIIASRNEIEIEPEYDMPYWESVWVDGPYTHNPDDPFPIPQGFTCEVQCAYSLWCSPNMDTNGEWDFYGTWLMVTNTEIPVEQTYYPFEMGWYPHSGQGTAWFFEAPPGGGVVPEQDYCGLYFESGICIYIPGDVNHNGAPLELADVLAMIASFRGLVEPHYLCQCWEDPPFYNFAATADPNGNCIPNELNDVVTEIGAYRGNDTASGCPDCPGSGPLLIGKYEDR